jgi:hypothetical protein
MKLIGLIGQRLLPALKEIGRELGLVSPFDRKPGSRRLSSAGEWQRVARAEALAQL